MVNKLIGTLYIVHTVGLRFVNIKYYAMIYLDISFEQIICHELTSNQG